MGKRKSARSDDFNMSEEIRNLLSEDRTMTSREVFEALEEKFPNQSINRNSCNVAFSQARRKLGIKGRRKSKAVKKPRTSSTTSTNSRATKNYTQVNMDLLKSASKFLSEAGDAQTAVSAIQQVAALQVNR